MVQSVSRKKRDGNAIETPQRNWRARATEGRLDVRFSTSDSPGMS